ncbi:MAG: hypothetical protein PHS45_01960 [Bacilli bacterium]|nr:hypothetical protein [Bacilli bacterium]
MNKKLVFLLFIFLFIVNINKVHAEVRMEINKAEIYGDGINIRGWAYIYGMDHGQDISKNGPTYTLILTEVGNPKNSKPFQSKGNNISYKKKFNEHLNEAYTVDLTCLHMGYVVTGKDEEGEDIKSPTCLQVLRGSHKFDGSKYNKGVDKLVEYAKSKGKNVNYYRDIGFEFDIKYADLPKKECDPNGEGKTEYYMSLKVTNNGRTETVKNISVLAKRVKVQGSNSQAITHPAPNTVKMINNAGWVHLMDETPSTVWFIGDYRVTYRAPKKHTIKKDLLMYEHYDKYYAGKDYYEKDYFRPYKVYWYSFDVQQCSKGSLKACPLGEKNGGSGKKIGWAPASWLEPYNAQGKVTLIVPPCPPPEKPEYYSCHNYPGPINYDSAPKKEYWVGPDNWYWNIECSEKSKVTLPHYPGIIKAGTGFLYNVEIENELTCDKSKGTYWNKDVKYFLDIEKDKEDIMDAKEIIKDNKKEIRDDLKEPRDTAVSNYEDYLKVKNSICQDKDKVCEEYYKCIHDELGLPDKECIKPDSCGEAEERCADASKYLNSLSETMDKAKTAYKAADREYNIANDEYEAARGEYIEARDRRIRFANDKAEYDNWDAKKAYQPSPRITPMVEGEGYPGIPRYEEISRIVLESDKLYVKLGMAYGFQPIYIEKHTGNISLDNIFSQYYFGGYKYYVGEEVMTGSEFELNLIIDELRVKQYGLAPWEIDYRCDYSVNNEFPGKGDSRDPDVGNVPPGIPYPNLLGDLYMFRPITLYDPFPGRNRKPGANWVGREYLLDPKINNIPVHQKDSYIYSVSLKPLDMMEIRGYNRDISYTRNIYTAGGKNYFINTRFSRLFNRGNRSIRQE